MHELLIKNLTELIPTTRYRYFPLNIMVIILLKLILLVFLVTGIFVYLLKEKDKTAILFFMFFSTFAFSINSPELIYVQDILRIPGVVIFSFFPSLFPCSLLHFFLLFPSKSVIAVKYPKIKKYVYFIFIILFPLLLYYQIIETYFLKSVINQILLDHTIIIVLLILMLTSLGIFIKLLLLLTGVILK